MTAAHSTKYKIADSQLYCIATALTPMSQFSDWPVTLGKRTAKEPVVWVAGIQSFNDT
jgi:hypothetical protein